MTPNRDFTTPKTYPRVLLLTQNKIQPFTGGGILLSNLFRHFPSDHLLFFHRDQSYEVESGHEDYRMVWSWLRVDPALFAAQLWRWLCKSLRRPRESNLWDLPALLPASSYFRFPSGVARRVELFRPDIIYAWAGDSLWARTVEHVSRRYRLPYVIHFMDNQFEVAPTTNLQRALAPAFRECLTRVVRSAASIFTISEPMGKAYQRHWDRPYEVYRGTIDIDAWPWPNPHGPKSDGVFRLGFAGSVDRSQLEGLRSAAAALDALSERGRRTRLVLFLTDYYAQQVRPVMAGLRSVEFREHPRPGELRQRFGEMDALVLAYAFDDASTEYYRYSFATKSVAYMLSGRPILARGPASIEPIDYCARGGWARVVNEPDQKSLMLAIEALIDDSQLRERMARAAWEAGCSEHDQGRHAARFAASLMHLAGSKTR